MPARDDHLTQAQHNREFAESLDAAKYSDWVATALFYAALHHVDAFLATRNVHPGRHDVRDNYVEKVTELRRLLGAKEQQQNRTLLSSGFLSGDPPETPQGYPPSVVRQK